MNLRTLGTIAMICSPALLIEAIWTYGVGPENNVVIGIASFVFMVGWLCSNLGMQQMQAIGTGQAAKIVLRIQFVGIFLATFFGIFEATGIVSEDNILFIVADMCWPLSMIFMIVVGIMAIRAKRWAGWQRFVPLFCSLWLVVALLLGLPAQQYPIFEMLSGLIGFAWTAVAWFTLALIVRSNATLATPAAVTLAETGHSDAVVGA
jgi:hypothetical protein